MSMVPSPRPKLQFFDEDGIPLIGGMIWTYGSDTIFSIGNLSQTLAPLTLSSTVSGGIIAALSESLAPLTLDSTADAGLVASLSKTLGHLTLSATDYPVILGAFDESLGTLSLSATVSCGLVSLLSKTLATLTISADGTITASLVTSDNTRVLIPFTHTTAPEVGGRELDSYKPEAMLVTGATRNTTDYKFSMGASWQCDSVNGKLVSDLEDWIYPNELVYGSNYTHDIWVRPTTLPSVEYATLFAIRSETYTAYLSPWQIAMQCYITTGGKIGVMISKSDDNHTGGSGGEATYIATDNGSLFSTNTWYHIRLVVVSGYLQIYLDGEAQKATPVAIPTGVTVGSGRGALWIGNIWDYEGTEDHRFRGQVQDYRALNIAANTGDFTPPDAPFDYF